MNKLDLPNNMLSKSFLDNPNTSTQPLQPDLQSGQGNNVNGTYAPVSFDAPVKNDLKVADNTKFVSSKKQNLPPYFSAYMAANGIKQVEPSAFKPYEEKQESVYIPQIINYSPNIAPVAVSPKKKLGKRHFFIILILIFTIAVGALLCLSEFEIVNFFEIVDGEEVVEVGAADIFNSLFKQIAIELGIEPVSLASTSYFYDMCLSLLKTQEQPPIVLIAIYMLPMSIMLLYLISVIVVIKCIVALAGNKKRRKLSFLPFLNFLCTIAFMLFGFIWAGNKSIIEVLNYIFGKADFSMGIMTVVLIGCAFLTFVSSWFAYSEDLEKIAKKQQKKAIKKEKWATKKLAKAAA